MQRPVNPLTPPATAANDRATGGVRYQDGVAATAVQLLGRARQPTLLTSAATAVTTDTVDIAALVPDLRQSLGLTLESLSVVSAGSRRRTNGDYPLVYDALLGTVPYAGSRETWLIIRIRSLDNAEALRCRHTAGTAALAATQRIAAGLRQRGIRCRIAAAPDIVAADRRWDCSAVPVKRRRLRGDTGWLTTYKYGDISTASLAEAWSLPADRVLQTITVLPDGRATATLTVTTPQPPTAEPSRLLHRMGRQAPALAAALCAPRPRLPGLVPVKLPDSLPIPVGPSGVLLGRLPGGDRFLLPLTDPATPGRVHIAATDAITRLIVLRAAAAGEAVTVHTGNAARWQMPGITLTDQPRPVPGTTLGMLDGSLRTAAAPATTVITLGAAPPQGADVLIVQTGPSSIRVTAAGRNQNLDLDIARAENAYLQRQPA